MHVDGTQICQINRWNNSFQNMYSMNRQKWTVWLRKLILCKKTQKNVYFYVHESELTDFGRTWTFQSDQTKNKKVLVFRDTEVASRNFGRP